MQSRTFGKIKLSIICPETSISSLSERDSGIMVAMIRDPVGKRPVATNGAVKVRPGPTECTAGGSSAGRLSASTAKDYNRACCGVEIKP